MAQLLVRNVSDRLVEGLKARARANGRSAEAEHRAILEAEFAAKTDAFWEQAARFREETRGRISTPSEELIRQDREERDRIR